MRLGFILKPLKMFPDDYMFLFNKPGKNKYLKPFPFKKDPNNLYRISEWCDRCMAPFSDEQKSLFRPTCIDFETNSDLKLYSYGYSYYRYNISRSLSLENRILYDYITGHSLSANLFTSLMYQLSFSGSLHRYEKKRKTYFEFLIPIMESINSCVKSIVVIPSSKGRLFLSDIIIPALFKDIIPTNLYNNLESDNIKNKLICNSKAIECYLGLISKFFNNPIFGDYLLLKWIYDLWLISSTQNTDVYFLDSLREEVSLYLEPTADEQIDQSIIQYLYHEENVVNPHINTTTAMEESFCACNYLLQHYCTIIDELDITSKEKKTLIEALRSAYNAFTNSDSSNEKAFYLLNMNEINERLLSLLRESVKCAFSNNHTDIMKRFEGKLGNVHIPSLDQYVPEDKAIKLISSKTDSEKIYAVINKIVTDACLCQADNVFSKASTLDSFSEINP